MKPSLSDKLVERGRINLTEKNEIIKTELEMAETLDSFFSKCFQ